jgi:carbamoyltransferase
MYILGINAYHGDSSACIIKDGVLIAAVEEERFRRIKHWAGLPTKSVEYCLNEAGIHLSEVSHIAINQNPGKNLWNKIKYIASGYANLNYVVNRVRAKYQRLQVVEQLVKELGSDYFGSFHQIEHHIAHLSSAFHVSPFQEAIVVSIDGFGDFSSGAWGIGSGSTIQVVDRVLFPHSLGIFYQALTQWLGFPNYGDEYKVMGLAPYGQPEYVTQLADIVQTKSDGRYLLNTKYFQHHRNDSGHEWKNSEPNIGILFSEELTKLLGPARRKEEELTQKHKNIARSVQIMYESALFNVLNRMHDRFGIDSLCLAGGCAMNSVANGKIYKNTPFKKVYVQSAAGDAGGAIGAAYSVWHKLEPRRSFHMSHSYWGPGFNNEKFDILLQQHSDRLLKESCRKIFVQDQVELCRCVADDISQGKVIGWFQGRMEWGPRALGNRSILGDPRRSDMKDILNHKIKRRESFRPFAPSVLRDEVSNWFEQEDDVPFMMQVYPVKSDKRSLIPAVTHVDGSGRLQTVTKDSNQIYYCLITEFFKKTGVPMVLNTSFNENEPIVCNPEEALECFIRTKMDILVLGNWIVRRD